MDIKDGKSMSAGANPYTLGHDRFNWAELSEVMQDMILDHADRRIEWTDFDEMEVPDDVVLREDPDRDRKLREFYEENGDGPINVNTMVHFAFERSQKILGPVTATFSRYIDTDRDNEAHGDFPEDLDLDDIAEQLNYHITYHDIIKIRLLELPPRPLMLKNLDGSLEAAPVGAGAMFRSWSIELTQIQADGNTKVILVDPQFLLNVTSHTMFVQQMREKLHMKYRRVAGVEQFTRP